LLSACPFYPIRWKEDKVGRADMQTSKVGPTPAPLLNCSNLIAT